ncbi:MAG: hypothetical protein EOT05_02150 [Candidatus Microsaccharimonas sossegonensis]|uniref:IrrE N-terminal-like domain-containing protein n=1 Tax=Candidatus Microsaccharimonas sossegonensis TaxID=2506948 RepID=A0A4Q0AHN7_9BACT|nr:MAG: hypothetical protein EOT05_02150 [Candidatus Microsaccharimonas sossegonensis]
MLSTHSLLPKLQAAYPHFSFTAGDRFAWSPDTQTIFYDTSDPRNTNLLIHELAHGVLEHRDYSKDVELIAMETEAWDTAVVLAAKYGIPISDGTVQDHLDTYRDWLHARSICPACEATGYQSAKNEYTCVACGHVWRVNEARLCGLRRYSKRSNLR